MGKLGSVSLRIVSCAVYMRRGVAGCKVHALVQKQQQNNYLYCCMYSNLRGKRPRDEFVSHAHAALPLVLIFTSGRDCYLPPHLHTGFLSRCSGTQQEICGLLEEDKRTDEWGWGTTERHTGNHLPMQQSRLPFQNRKWKMQPIYTVIQYTLKLERKWWYCSKKIWYLQWFCKFKRRVWIRPGW